MTRPVAPAAFYHSADYMRKMFHIVVPNDTPIADILKPSFWVNGAGVLNTNTLIDIVSQDGLLDMQVRVMRVTADGLVIVRPRMIWEDESRKAEIARVAAAEEANADPNRTAPEGYKVGYNPGKKLFYVQLKATGKKLREDFQSKALALDFADQHAKVMDTPSPTAVKKVA